MGIKDYKIHGSIQMRTRTSEIYWEKENQWLPRTGCQGRWLNAKAPQETFWGDGNSLYLDYGGRYTILYVC